MTVLPPQLNKVHHKESAPEMTEAGAILHACLTFITAVLSWHQWGQVNPGLCDQWPYS